MGRKINLYNVNLVRSTVHYFEPKHFYGFPRHAQSCQMNSGLVALKIFNLCHVLSPRGLRTHVKLIAARVIFDLCQVGFSAGSANSCKTILAARVIFDLCQVAFSAGTAN
jgi:hypothetical protein